MANILIVDDEEADRLGLAALLKGTGHELHFADNGRDALQLYLEHTIHLVITDLMMAGGDGLDLITSLRHIKPDASIIAVSGKGPSGLSVANAMGVDRVFMKPVSVEELIKAVTQALGPGPPRKGTD